MAGTTGLEPATSAVTGQRSNQLSYVPRCCLAARWSGVPELARCSALQHGDVIQSTRCARFAGSLPVTVRYTNQGPEDF